MKIVFDEITDSGLGLEIDDQSWFPDQEIKRLGPVVANIFLQRKNERVLLSGRFEVLVELSCDRCLEQYQETLRSEFKLDLEYLKGGDLSQPLDDHECTDSDMEVVFLEKPEVDLFLLLQQQVVLTLPTKKLCSEQCKGLCPGCGGNNNKGSCSCSGADSSSPFNVLKKLKYS